MLVTLSLLDSDLVSDLVEYSSVLKQLWDIYINTPVSSHNLVS